jgi:exodeoxyribonuclease VII small subunit
MNDQTDKGPFEIPLDQFTYEQAMEQLGLIVETLESDERSLDKSLALFERGQALAQYCGSLLDKTELRVKQILGEEIIDFES